MCLVWFKFPLMRGMSIFKILVEITLSGIRIRINIHMLFCAAGASIEASCVPLLEGVGCVRKVYLSSDLALYSAVIV